MKNFLLLILLLISSCVSTTSSPENFTKINDKLYCGGSPEEDQFAYLRAQGIKSVICVDGAGPNLKAAQQQGLTYKHVPVTYATITVEQQKSLAKAYNDLEKPVYIHCHHGKHRGPAASAIVLKNHYDWKNDQLVQYLTDSGTSKNYAGLYKTISQSKKIPSQEWQKTNVPESAEVDPLASTMADLDRVWIKLKKQFSIPLSIKENIIAQQRTLLLKEYFVELHRMTDTKFDDEYLEIIEKIKKLEASLQNNFDPSKAFQVVAKDCKSCHEDYRN
ncbi:MAG: sulfur transferase domain-containing protein [Lentisphaeraceae bacterium]|nr:sulfur transferase domain-containing protein [Lentisphaeraceae bacterium]